MKFSSLAAPKVVKMTTFSAASDENFVKMTTFPFQCTQTLTVALLFFLEKDEWFCGAPPNNEMAMIHIKMNMWNLKLCETH